jgi:broad specificity phosphatase PhoE
MRRLLLVRHASTDAVRAAAFGTDEPLDASGAAAAARLRLPRAAEVLVSPARRAAETAERAGLAVTAVEPALAECDFGRWAGWTLRAVADTEPDAVRAWMTDPSAAPHGGESLLAVLARVRGWLEAQAARSGTAVAVTHAGVVKAAVVTALDAPPSAFWRIDVSPLAVTELHAHDGRWTVTRVNDRGAGVDGRGDARPRGGDTRADRGAGAAQRDEAWAEVRA